MKTKEIKSKHNKTFRVLLKLTKARGIKKSGLALFSGVKQVEEVLREFPDRCMAVLCSSGQNPPLGSIENDIHRFSLKTALFEQIDFFNTNHPLLLLRVAPFPHWSDTTETGGCTLFIPFQDPANVGAVIRSAAAFGVDRIVLLKEAAHPFLPKSARAAGSMLFRVPIFQGPALQTLQETTKPIITLSPDGRDIRSFRFPTSFRLMPGLEGPGLPDQLRGNPSLSIPMEPGVRDI